MPNTCPITLTEEGDIEVNNHRKKSTAASGAVIVWMDSVDHCVVLDQDKIPLLPWHLLTHSFQQPTSFLWNNATKSITTL